MTCSGVMASSVASRYTCRGREPVYTELYPKARSQFHLLQDQDPKLVARDISNRTARVNDLFRASSVPPDISLLKTLDATVDLSVSLAFIYTLSNSSHPRATRRDLTGRLVASRVGDYQVRLVPCPRSYDTANKRACVPLERKIRQTRLASTRGSDALRVCVTDAPVAVHWTARRKGDGCGPNLARTMPNLRSATCPFEISRTLHAKGISDSNRTTVLKQWGVGGNRKFFKGSG
jgi:hypothetical protein